VIHSISRGRYQQQAPGQGDRQRSDAASLQAASAALQHDLRTAVDIAGELLAGHLHLITHLHQLRRRAAVVWIIQAITFFAFAVAVILSSRRLQMQPSITRVRS
jgi:hypothetical protein